MDRVHQQPQPIQSPKMPGRNVAAPNNGLAGLQTMADAYSERSQVAQLQRLTSQATVQRVVKIGDDSYPSEAYPHPRYFRRELMLNLHANKFKELGTKAMWAYVDALYNAKDAITPFASWEAFTEHLWDKGHLMRRTSGSGFGPRNLGSRPAFYKTTTDLLELGDGEHRRHIISSSSLGRGIEKGYEALGKQYDDKATRLGILNRCLADLGGTACTTEYAALRQMWTMVHNHTGNLWVGDGAFNSAIGFIRTPLRGLLESDLLAGDGDVDVDAVAKAVQGIRATMKSIEVEWTSITDVLAETLRNADPRIDSIGLGFAGLKSSEQIKDICGDDLGGDIFDLFRPAEKEVMVAGFMSEGRAVSLLQDGLDKIKFMDLAPYRQIFFQNISWFSFTPTTLPKITVRRLVTDWIANADVDYPFGQVDGNTDTKKDYFSALDRFYSTILDGESTIFEPGGALKKFLGLSFRG